jgi:uncharacterized protein YmfQ (DUF2313 family)
MPIDLGSSGDADQAVEGASLDRVEVSANILLTEMFPEGAYLLLIDWERVLGLTPLAGDTIAIRQNRCLAKLRSIGRLDLQYFIDLAAQMGVTVVIEEMTPFMAGWSYAGHEIMPPEGFFVWRVWITASEGQYFRAGASAAGESLGVSIIDAVKELFQELKPVHTLCYFMP